MNANVSLSDLVHLAYRLLKQDTHYDKQKQWGRILKNKYLIMKILLRNKFK